MIEGKTIVCFASGYDAPPTSKHHVMHRLAERNVVLWVNYHASRAPSASASDFLWICKKLGKVFRGTKTVRKNLHVLTPLVVPLPGRSWARKLNRWLLRRALRRAIKRFGSGEVDVWSFAPDVEYALDALSPSRVVYYCVDDFAHFSGYDTQQILRDEEALARRADLVITTSKPLLDTKASWNPNTILIPHGVEYDHFASANQATPPEALTAIAQPRFGFFGLIRDWIDLELLVEVARRQPAWQFVLLGDSTEDLSAAKSLSNVHCVGPVPYADLPAWCAGFDVGLIPFKRNELTEAVNPIKLREYLAAGLPVISSRLPEVVEYDQWVEFADTPDEFIAAAERALARTPAQHAAAQEAMRSETWEAKLAEIESHLS
ncbi:MAG: glycosyltransferase [Phycisphaerales bacterium]|jgi:glycosyltransferase involved in cell wall biosynthesis|nr:glycosyltransferase [Phycisphaerales bacterium]MBT7171638.1 glycosyltransferase [Phycisphaerales bacterium]